LNVIPAKAIHMLVSVPRMTVAYVRALCAYVISTYVLYVHTSVQSENRLLPRNRQLAPLERYQYRFVVSTVVYV
jgi:hypothetical protein